jgi:hypothetical protein
MNRKLRDQLKQLRLSGLAASLDVRLDEAKSTRLDHSEFLETILQDELSVHLSSRCSRQLPPASRLKAMLIT